MRKHVGLKIFRQADTTLVVARAFLPFSPFLPASFPKLTGRSSAGRWSTWRCKFKKEDGRGAAGLPQKKQGRFGERWG